jgi:hypothetical protein
VSASICGEGRAGLVVWLPRQVEPDAGAPTPDWVELYDKFPLSKPRAGGGVIQCRRCSLSPTRMSQLIRASRFPIGRSMSAAEHACAQRQPILGQGGCAASSPAASAKREMGPKCPMRSGSQQNTRTPPFSRASLPYAGRDPSGPWLGRVAWARIGRGRRALRLVALALVAQIALPFADYAPVLFTRRPILSLRDGAGMGRGMGRQMRHGEIVSIRAVSRRMHLRRGPFAEP